MNRKSLSALFSMGVLLLALSVARAQDRALLFSQSPSEPLQKILALLRNPTSPQTDARQLTWSTHYFVRIAPRSAILTQANALTDSANSRQSDAILGTRPFVFLTSPESLYGRSLLEIYQDIGYEAEDILHYQLNQDMVAVVFRYPDEIVPSPEITDGKLPLNWNTRVYVPYWDNAFSLFHHLAQDATVEPTKTGQFAPYRLFFNSEEEKAFALKASKGINPRLKRLSYLTLKVRGSHDWRYRQLLEDKLSLFEHFRGIGRTQNEVSDPDARLDGLVEFVGPNRKLKDLPEIAVVDLGRLTITNTYQTSEPVAATH
ncbi:hypothetical protein IAD21_04454 [Abditibacteriota bacterium]|nr:hypothetical protein IAD21_04454 [Abditibacteriota bacterium]